MFYVCNRTVHISPESIIGEIRLFVISVSVVSVAMVSVAMATSCFFVIVASFALSSTAGFTQSHHQDNDVLYVSMLDQWRTTDVHRNVNVSVNLRMAVREVDRRYVSITLDSSLVDYHWPHFDFRYDASYL